MVHRTRRTTGSRRRTGALTVLAGLGTVPVLVLAQLFVPCAGPCEALTFLGLVHLAVALSCGTACVALGGFLLLARRAAPHPGDDETGAVVLACVTTGLMLAPVLPWFVGADVLGLVVAAGAAGGAIGLGVRAWRERSVRWRRVLAPALLVTSIILGLLAFV